MSKIYLLAGTLVLLLYLEPTPNTFSTLQRRPASNLHPLCSNLIARSLSHKDALYFDGEVINIPEPTILSVPYQVQATPRFWSLISSKVSAKDQGRLKSVEKIFYPASGHDLQTAFELFPNAEILVMLDNHPAFRPQDFKLRKKFEPKSVDEKLSSRGYLNFNEMGSSQLEYLLGSLEKSFPLARYLSITMIKDSRNVYFSDVQDTSSTQGRGAHCIIEFEADNKKRTVIYINANMNISRSSSDSEIKFWTDFVRQIDFDGLLLKSAMGRFEGGSINLEFREALLSILKANEGVLVEGKGVFESRRFGNPEWELSSDGAKVGNRQYQVTTSEKFRFGYGNSFQLSFFGR
jgi:hypothetical protein